jgi:hypothetical protein
LGTNNFDEDYVLEQLRALDESSARGWLLWSAGNKYDVVWKALAQWEDVPLETTISVSLYIDDSPDGFD